MRSKTCNITCLLGAVTLNVLSRELLSYSKLEIR
jgi:hypothetical protein